MAPVTVGVDPDTVPAIPTAGLPPHSVKVPAVLVAVRVDAGQRNHYVLCSFVANLGLMKNVKVFRMSEC